MEYTEKFKAKARQLRGEMNWAQEDLARELDVSLSAVQRWEGKGAKPARHSRRVLQILFQKVGIGDE
ncbi:MAG: helix-turn-helix transcriptional regulator [Dehalococcoidales bacterium]|jgi:DNA-binding transcriptional regulator YiaG|nr:helix-turn-helix transcriptional regulator [Dehalococcoidales bacterium]